MLELNLYCLALALLLTQYSVSAASVSIEADEEIYVEPIEPVQHIPTSDGRLHIYALPVGQGDAHVIQCPRGELSIVDLGTSDGVNAGFWSTSHITAFLQGHFHLIRNVVLTHNHDDHYRYLPSVLHSNAGMTGLQNIYVSCNTVDMHINVQNWLRNISAESRVRTFNGGRACGPNNIACGNMALCPGDNSVVAKVLAVNLANCVNSNKNIDSIVFKITHGQVSVLMNGDFEDYTSSAGENGPQKSLVDFYGSEMRVTVYKLSHHAAENLANKLITCQAHAPKAIFVSGNPWYTQYRHPRCTIIDYFINNVRSLCRPLETNTASQFYCGAHPLGSIPNGNKLQDSYTCGEPAAGVLRSVTNNQNAIYTTVPQQFLLNNVEFISDGTRWGFRNNYYPRA